VEDEFPPFAAPSAGQPTPPPATPPPATPVQAAPVQATPVQSPPAQRFGPPPQLASPPQAFAVATPNYLPAPPPPRRRLTRASVIGIVAGSVALVLIVAGAIGGSILVLQTVGHHSSAGGSGSTSSAPPAVPHAGGVKSSSTAQKPLNCSANCFDSVFAIAGDTVPPPSAITALGLTKTIDSLGDYSSSTPADEYDQTLSAWQDAKATPPECFFSYFQSPVVAGLGEKPSRDATQIDYSGTHSDKAKNNILTQAVRVFANSSDADAYMQQLAAAIDGCPSYRTSDSSGSLDTTVKAAKPFSDFPDSEAAVGWIESSYGGHYESIDVQRGNLVVRTTLESYDDAVSDAQFRSFVNEDAWQIAAMLTPGDGR